MGCVRRKPYGNRSCPAGAVEIVGVDALIDPCRACGLAAAGGSEIRPYRVRWNIAVHLVGVDALIDPCRASGLAAAGGSEIRPYWVRWNIAVHLVGARMVSEHLVEIGADLIHQRHGNLVVAPAAVDGERHLVAG